MHITGLLLTLIPLLAASQAMFVPHPRNSSPDVHRFGLRNGSFPLSLRTPRTALAYTSAAQDTCLYADSTTVGNLTFTGLPSAAPSLTYSFLDTCLCLSNMSSVLATDASALYLTQALGYTEVNHTLSTFVNDSPSSRRCAYPPNSHPLCSADNTCGFVCAPPLVLKGKACVVSDSKACTTTPSSTCRRTQLDKSKDNHSNINKSKALKADWIRIPDYRRRMVLGQPFGVHP